MPDDLITGDWMCYSVGAGNDVSFDIELIARYGARVRAFDPFFIFREMAETRAGGDPRYSFHEVAVTASDGAVEMFGRQDDEKGAVSAVNLYGARTSFTKPGRSLALLMAEFGEDRVDLLKIDVEGSEYELVPTLDLDRMGVRVLCLAPSQRVGRACSQAVALVASARLRARAPQAPDLLHLRARLNPATATATAPYADGCLSAPQLLRFITGAAGNDGGILCPQLCPRLPRLSLIELDLTERISPKLR